MIDIKSHSNAIVCIFLAALSWNVVRHGNFLFVFVTMCLMGALIYEHQHIDNTKTKPPYNLKDKLTNDLSVLEALARSFEDRFGGKTLSTSHSRFNKIPKRFIYIFKNDVLWRNMLNIRFIGKYNEFALVKIYAVIEYFTKIYHKIMNHRIQPEFNIDILYDLHTELHHLQNELSLTIPRSKIKYNLTLDQLVDSNLKVISHYFKEYIKNVKALIKNKI